MSAASSGAELKPQTLDAWRDYVSHANGELQDRLRARKPFMRADGTSEMRGRLQRGEVIVAPAAEDTPKHVPFGLIHDWVASAFIPNVHVEDVISVLRDYDGYRQFYKPTVIDSRELGAIEGQDSFSLLLRNRSLMARAAVESDYRSIYKRLDSTRWYSLAWTTRIQEIENYGKADEHKLDAGEGTGYVWRVLMITTFEGGQGGVYIDTEAIALSRDIPGSLRWMIEPMIRRVAKNTLTSFMRSTRLAVCGQTE